MSEFSVKSVCCTCLSNNRKIYPLYKIQDGLNLLYLLLSHDPEAYKEGFYKDAASLLVCWECRAVIHRIKRFQTQVCLAQTRLTESTNGRHDVSLNTFSHLKTTHNRIPNYHFQSEIIAENFIDCGFVENVKEERDSDDIPLSEFCNEPAQFVNLDTDTDNEDLKTINNHEKPTNLLIANKLTDYDKQPTIKRKNSTKNREKPTNNNKKPTINGKKPTNNGKKPTINVKKPTINAKKPTENDKLSTSDIKHENDDKFGFDCNIIDNLNTESPKVKNNIKIKMKYKKYITITTMDEQEMLRNVEKRRLELDKDAYKCEDCIIVFESENALLNHNMDLHVKKDGSHCDICHAYIEDLPTHRQSHYYIYNCTLCTHVAYTHTDIVEHMKNDHYEVCSEKRKNSKKAKESFEERKYPCSNCGLNFQNKDLRWKHVQKAHREGFRCGSCSKRFAFKHNLERHERTHQGPYPREECPTCHKLVRVDLLKVHRRTHSARQPYSCAQCDKVFVCRATYETHLKYARAHADVTLVCRHACGLCEKRYRTRAELQDHVNYQHKGQAAHKCPVCHKGFATKRCIGRHVRRAHQGLKEGQRDKMCQRCGKAFRDKKVLIEHERVHTGARPLSCRHCGRRFRQRAALYAHTRRLHPDN